MTRGLYEIEQVGFNGFGHGPIFGTILGPNLNSVSITVRFSLNFSLLDSASLYVNN